MNAKNSNFNSRRIRNLISNTNRRGELVDSETIYGSRNSSGVFVHALVIRPFQWEINRDSWSKEEIESIHNNTEGVKWKNLKFVEKLMKQDGMVRPDKDFLTKAEEYPFEFRHGDLVKLVIFDHGYPRYPEFRDNDGTYVILRKSISKFDLGVFPLSYSFDVMGSIHRQISFDGEDIFPDAYLNLMKGGEVCHCSNEISDMIVANVIPEVFDFKEHPIPLYSNDPESKNYGFILSEFDHNDKRYRFSIPFNLNIRKLKISTITKAMKYRMNKTGFVCELIESGPDFYYMFVHDYILVRGDGVYRSEISQNLWDYFHSYDPEESQRIPKLKEWMRSEKDSSSLEEKFCETVKGTKLKSWSLTSLKRHGLRKSGEKTLQFELEDSYAHVYVTPPNPNDSE